MFWRETGIYRTRALERIASPDDREDVIQLVAPKAWIPLSVVGATLVLAIVWMFAGHIPTIASGRGMAFADNASLPLNVAYVPLDEANKIRVGMPARISFEQNGRATGVAATVVSISTAPLTAEQARARLVDADAASPPQLLCPCLEVVAAIAPAAVVHGKTPTTLRVTIERRHPIAYILPVLSRITERN
jgi:hypothetical protein